MGVNQSKGSVNISSTPNKEAILNGKKSVDTEKVEEKTQVRNLRHIFPLILANFDGITFASFWEILNRIGTFCEIGHF